VALVSLRIASGNAPRFAGLPPKPRPAARRGVHVTGQGDTTRRHALAQGARAGWRVTGVWPILRLRSFEAVTGPKKERWLVKTMGR
jgi:hypothetical protein